MHILGAPVRSSLSRTLQYATVAALLEHPELRYHVSVLREVL